MKPMNLATKPNPVLDGQLNLVLPLPKVKKKKMTPAERLEKFTVKTTGGCWHFIGAIDPGSIGYGRLNIDGKMHYAHRLAYELEHGPIPDGLLLRHRCHNPCCVNTAHHVLGTHADNSADMVAAKRQGRKLSRADVLQIVGFSNAGRSVEHLAEQFKVGAITVRKIILGKTHAKITGIVHEPKAPFNHRKLKKAA